jgi:hypothetical protein
MFNLIKLTIVASICLYIIGLAFAWSAENTNCKGWDCEEVTCWDGYAVRLPDGTYLPCDKFDEYVNGNKGVVIK